MGAEGERELMRGVCVGRKPGCPRPSGRAVHIGVPPLLDSAWELGLLLLSPSFGGENPGADLFAVWLPLLFPLWLLCVKVLEARWLCSGA